jgi:23S rRNA G2445 N2-methylase RlmL
MTVWEPACGDGAMSNVLATQFAKVINSDIHPMMENAATVDFYKYEPDEKFQWIITNPPYGEEVDKFMDRILYFVENRNCFGAIIARNELDSAKGRAKYFRDLSIFSRKESSSLATTLGSRFYRITKA